MKKLFTIFFILFCFVGQAATYYVKAAGGAGTGLDDANAWSFAHFKTRTFAAGDNILFKRGDTFYGTWTVTNSGSSGNRITYGAYGSGAKPVFTGLSTVTGWVDLGGNIWEAPVTDVQNNVNLVLLDNVIQQVGRYPNTNAANGGYLLVTSATSTSITGPALSSVTNWTNAEVVVRTKRWVLERLKVTSHSAGVIGFAAGRYTAIANQGYFFQRDPRTLDQFGEWYYDTTNSKLRMYFAGNNPASYSVQISTVDTIINTQSKSYVTLRDFQIVGPNMAGISNNNGSNFNVISVDVNRSGIYGIKSWTGNNILVDSCTVDNALGSAIFLMTFGNTQAVTNCVTDSTALIGGMEIPNDGTTGAHAAIAVKGDTMSLLNNVIKNTGYCGIWWIGNNVYIRNNFIDSFCIVRDDGGGIYAYEMYGSVMPKFRFNRNIDHNIVLHGIGNSNGTTSAYSSARGIYLDEGMRHVDVDSNTVAYCTNAGFYNNSVDSISITNNVSFQNYYSHSFQRFETALPIREVIFTGNVLYPYRMNYANLEMDNPAITRNADILAMGTFDYNYYSLRSGTDTSLKTVTLYANGTNYTENYYPFSYITGTIGTETHSVSSANTGSLYYNATNSPVETPLGANYVDPAGVAYTSLTLQPFTSKVLIYVSPTRIIYKAGGKILKLGGKILTN